MSSNTFSKILHDYNSVYGVVKTLLSDFRKGHSLSEEDFKSGFASLESFQAGLERLALIDKVISEEQFSELVESDSKSPLPEEIRSILVAACFIYDASSVKVYELPAMLQIKITEAEKPLESLANGGSLKAVAAERVLEKLEGLNGWELSSPFVLKRL